MGKFQLCIHKTIIHGSENSEFRSVLLLSKLEARRVWAVKTKDCASICLAPTSQFDHVRDSQFRELKHVIEAELVRDIDAAAELVMSRHLIVNDELLTRS